MVSASDGSLGRRPPHLQVTSPGRFQVTNIEKLVAVYFLQKFDAKLDSAKNLNFEWRDTLVPNPNTILTMKRQSKEVEEG